MLLFLASVLEQLDLALEHVVKGDVHNARFALMLTDNALELVLHQIALDKRSELKAFSWRNEIYPHQTALDKALGQSFGEKVSFARLIDKMSEETSQTARIMQLPEVQRRKCDRERIRPGMSSRVRRAACERR
jgi:hypothetical protein